jgi:NADPH-dependent 2,4-dienoyl-CoA reductase/sulfur reductase-like enzyme
MRWNKEMKVIIVGCTHAGTITATQILKGHPETEVTIYERNDNVSFLSCGIAVYLSGDVGDPDAMFYSSPKQLADLGATVKMQHNVTNIDPQTKTVEVTDLVTGETTTDHYDKLVDTTGSWPVIPPIPGVDGPHVYLCKNYHHAKELFNVAKKAERIIVIGGGYIGVELVEAYTRQNKDVTLVDGSPRMLHKYFDQEYTSRIQKQFEDHGAHFAFDQRVTGFEDHGDAGVTVKTDKGSYDADIAILCVGFRPNTDLLKGKVKLHDNGAIVTNEYMQSSDPDIYAAGDSTAVHYNPTGKDAYIPLATNAIRQGTIVGVNLFGNTMKDMGTQSSSGLNLYGTTMVSSGLTLENAKDAGFDAEAVTIEDNYRPEFMPTTTPVLMTLVWDKKTRQILGGQLMSKHDVSQSANVLSLCIQDKHTIDYLAFVDMLFQPHFDRPFNYLNILGQAAVAKAR